MVNKITNLSVTDRRRTLGSSGWTLPFFALMMLIALPAYECSEPPQELLCVNHDCTGMISTATTLTHYKSPEKFLLSFDKNSKVRVLAKPKDPKDEYWGVEINGAVGFIPNRFLRENSIFSKPKQMVDVKTFLKLNDELNEEKEKRSKNDNRNEDIEEVEEEIVDEDENEYVDDPNEAVVNDPTLPPTPKPKKTDQYYKERMRREQDNKFRKYRTQNLKMRSTTEEPIVSSAIPDSDTNVNEIRATQSETVIDGTTFYPGLVDANIDDEKISQSTMQKDILNQNSPSKDENIQISPHSLINNNVDSNLKKSAENEHQISQSSSEDKSKEDILTKSVEMSNSNNTPETVISENEKVASENISNESSENVTNDDNQKKFSDNIVNDNEPKEPTENLSSEQNDSKHVADEENGDNVDIKELEMSNSRENIEESKEKNESEESGFQKLINQIDSSETNENKSSDEETIVHDDLNENTQIDDHEHPENDSDINNNENEHFENTLQNQSVLEKQLEADVFHQEIKSSPNESDANDINSPEINIEIPIIESTANENSNENHSIETNFHNVEKFNNSDELEIKTQNDFDFMKIPSVNYNIYENNSNIDSNLNINETDSNLPMNAENNTMDNIENVIGTETYPPSVETLQITTEETHTDSFNQQYIQSETSTAKYDEYINNYEPHSPLDFDSTTENSNIFDNSPNVDSIPSYVDSEKVEDKKSFDYEENLNDKIQQPNILESDIENEKSFFSSPLSLFINVYNSISNIIKSNGISNTIEKANTNILDSEDIKSNDYQQFESSDRSQQYMSMFTETSKCSVEEKSMPSISDISTDFIFWLIISAVSVLMFTLGYYYLENRKQDGKLLAMVNTLQKELLCSSKECIILKEELTITKEKLMGIEDSSFGSNEMVVCLKKELADNQQTISDLQEKLISTEEELANSTEAALELQSILDEQLSAKDTSSSSLAFTITNLQSQLDDQQTTMNLTKAQLAAKVEENELLLLKVLDANNQYSLIEKQLLNTQDSLKQAVEENESKSQQLQELASNLEKNLLHAETQRKSEVKELMLQIKDLRDEFNNNKALLKARNQELQTLQENVKALQTDENNISAILNDSHTKAELVKITAEKNLLTEKFEAESSHVKELNKKIDEHSSMISELKEQLSEADQKTIEATTRLEVLTNYFNQKEADLLKELNTKEALWMSQRGEAMSTVEKIQNLQQEIQQHKDTTESIRREVVEQEAAWRAKVAALEQRAHEHWLARRAAERSAEASAREAQTLRQRLAAPSPDKRVVSPLTTGESIPDPAFLPLSMLPPPPLGFLPPPLGGPMLLPPPLPPHRPPPLGRLSSPPPLQPMRSDRSYSPDSRYSPERAYSPLQRGRSPFSNSESRRRTYNNNRRYDNRYYDSEEDRRSRRYETETDFSPVNTLPPSPTPNSRNHKGSSKFDNSEYSP